MLDKQDPSADHFTIRDPSADYFTIIDPSTDHFIIMDPSADHFIIIDPSVDYFTISCHIYIQGVATTHNASIFPMVHLMVLFQL